jgi:PAS domain S-box-containing protein
MTTIDESERDKRGACGESREEGSGRARIVFLDGGDGSTRAEAVAGLAERYAGDAIEVESASIVSVASVASVSPGVSDRRQAVGVRGLEPGPVDVVVTLDEHARRTVSEECGLGERTCCEGLGADGGGEVSEAGTEWPFWGDPSRIHWPMGDVPVHMVDEELSSRVRGLFEGRVLASLVEERRAKARLMDFLDIGVVGHDTRRRIFLFNEMAERITGRAKEEVIGRDCYEVFAPKGLCGEACLQRSGEEAWLVCRRYDGKLLHSDGKVRRLRLASAPLRCETGRPLGALVSFRDVTEVAELRERLGEQGELHGIVGGSGSMREIFATIKQVAPSNYPVLVTGESGTGKELVARAIHLESNRREAPFVPINCGALPENILESELFGHVRGAFTGAIRDKLGRFELADRGTLFLDEVGEVSQAFQVKLLRVLQEGAFDRVGGEETVEVDVRIISASNRNLREMMARGEFREDLYYRLAVVPLHLPPLRERGGDVELLVDRLFDEVRTETGRPELALSPSARSTLSGYRWPGNVRELINALQFAAVRCPTAEIQIEHLPPEVREGGRTLEPTGHAVSREEGRGSRRTKLDLEKVTEALERTGGNKSRAARLLGVSRATLYRFLDRLE